MPIISEADWHRNKKTVMKSYQDILHKVVKTPDIDTTLTYEGILGYLDRVERDQIGESYGVIKSIWHKVHYIYLWNWISILLVFSFVITLVIGITMCN